MKTESPLVSAGEVVAMLAKGEPFRALDVRAEGEFRQGSVPVFVNVPILNDSERHQVGLRYKQQGQAAAIVLGHALVDPSREERVALWARALSGPEPAFVSCWRGGLRSRIAGEWLQAAGVRAVRVQGGYKALRRILADSLRTWPPLLVLAGATGSRKTALLESLDVPKIHLEALAKHRGSAFGRWIGVEQPSQATFENGLAVELLRCGLPSRILLEDESLMIGRVKLPNELKARMRLSSVVRVQVDLETRVSNIHDDYVVQPLARGHGPAAVAAFYDESLGRIQNKLGGLLTSRLREAMRDAFARGDAELHRHWIRELLRHYYDRTYEHAFGRQERPVVFEGGWDACHSWIQKQFC